MKLSRTNEWGLIISSVDGVQPTGAMGVAVTPTQNTTGGAYATLLAGASVTQDVYGIEVNINNVGISATARDCLATLAIDPAGGAAFTDIADLLCGSAGFYAANASNVITGGADFFFPLWIKAGSTIGMRGSVNSATLTAFNAFVRLYCKPSKPELVWCGQKIEQLGVTTASSTGVNMTAGTAAEGAWTSIGTLARDARFFEFGFGLNDAACFTSGYNVDVSVGDVTDKKPIVLDALVMTTTSELTGKRSCPTWATAKAGDIAYARTQVGTSADTHSIAVYAMGD